MTVTTGFMQWATGMSPGTILAMALSGVFAGMSWASIRIAKRLQVRN